jgi:hypothetical protein
VSATEEFRRHADPVGVKDPPEIDDLDHDRRRRHTRIWVGGLTLVLLLS